MAGDEVRGRGLAVGAGHGDDRQLGTGTAEERIGERRHGVTRISGDRLRQRDIELALDDEGHGAALDRLGGVIVAVARAPRTHTNSAPGVTASAR